MCSCALWHSSPCYPTQSGCAILHPCREISTSAFHQLSSRLVFKQCNWRVEGFSSHEFDQTCHCVSVLRKHMAMDDFLSWQLVPKQQLGALQRTSMARSKNVMPEPLPPSSGKRYTGRGRMASSAPLLPRLHHRPGPPLLGTPSLISTSLSHQSLAKSRV